MRFSSTFDLLKGGRKNRCGNAVDRVCLFTGTCFFTNRSRPFLFYWQIEILPESRLGKRSTCFNVEKKIWQRRHISSSPFRRLQSVQQQRNRDYRQRPIGFPEQAPPPRALAPPLLRCGFGGGIRPRNLSFSFCFFCCWVRFFFFRSFLLGLFVFCCFFLCRAPPRVYFRGPFDRVRVPGVSFRRLRGHFWNVLFLLERFVAITSPFAFSRIRCRSLYRAFLFFFVLFLLFFLQYPF